MGLDSTYTTMKTYKYTGNEEKHFPDLEVLLKPGETFETDKEVNHPEIEAVDDKHKNHTKESEESHRK